MRLASLQRELNKLSFLREENRVLQARFARGCVWVRICHQGSSYRFAVPLCTFRFYDPSPGVRRDFRAERPHWETLRQLPCA